MSNLIGRRSVEVLGMLAVGDGTIGALAPQRHVDLWRGGPRAWNNTIGWFADRPALTRTLALAEVAAGIWLMLRANRS